METGIAGNASERRGTPSNRRGRARALDWCKNRGDRTHWGGGGADFVIFGAAAAADRERGATNSRAAPQRMKKRTAAVHRNVIVIRAAG